ncbi:hypothetical protein G6F62_015709 [Rhizopus arrhizus]|nr:hypothetical protein G6F62_015709 [Rhizopus arrhizus]
MARAALLRQPPHAHPRAVARQRIRIVLAGGAQALPQWRGIQIVAIDEQERLVRHGGGDHVTGKARGLDADHAAHQVRPRMERAVGHFDALAVRQHQARDQ